MKEKFLFLVLLCLALASFGQTTSNKLESYIPPAPNVAALALYGDIPVNAYTGIPNISIPLYTINSKDINLPISLSYHAGGIRIVDEASWVGLGWSLNAGGIISRTIRGEDDFSNTSLGYYKTPGMPQPISSDPNSPNYNNINLTTTDLPYFQDQCEANKDSEPDIFTFNFFGKTGKFIIYRPTTQGQQYTIRMMNLQPFKIDFSFPNGVNSTPTWKVTTDDGYSYNFTVAEVSISSVYTNTVPFESDVYNYDWINPSFYGRIKVLTTSWHLTSVVSPQNNIITF